MKNEFYQYIFEKQQRREPVPSNEDIASWALKVISLLYPEHAKSVFTSVNQIGDEFASLQSNLVSILNATRACLDCDNELNAKKFFEGIPDLYAILNTDISAILNGDPAARSEFEVIRAYPGFYAISFYRIAHLLHKLDIPFLPRILTEYAHSKTGIDIHPAAEIGDYLFIDHGTGLVIGETCKIGRNVKLYQGVTLGAMSVEKNMAHIKRHPTVEDHVVIYSGASILGGDTVIGHHSLIGGNAWLTKSVPPYSTVYHKSRIIVVEGKLKS